MQQSQQHLLSIRHKLPEPNSLLPLSMQFEPAYHLRKRVKDIQTVSSIDWPLDAAVNVKSQNLAPVLHHYYGSTNNMKQLLKARDSIVFINSLVNSLQFLDEDYYFGSISTCLERDRKSMTIIAPNAIESDLEFDDRIESGNLYFALKHDQRTYILANRLDYNTRSYGQWFYFKVTNRAELAGLYRFHIINMTKTSTLFGKGMKISVCRNGVWGKEGLEIEYTANKFSRSKNMSFKQYLQFGQNYYTLSFSLHIEAQQTIYVSYNEPYTYTKLGQKLNKVTVECPNFKRSTLCRTPLGNRIQILTISKKSSVKVKKIIFIAARAHPIETAGSFVMEGIIDEITALSLSPQVEKLLENFIIKIIPMMNPDGVIVGNSRCNLHGYDLNRQWKNPKQNVSPEIVSIKKEILKYEGRIEMFLDIHGHSKKKNYFAYGCHDVREPFASREFPFILSKFSERGFAYSECRFTRLSETKKEGKQGTARISLWNRLKIPNIFTIENSYCSASNSQYHYDHKSYGDIGRDIIKALCVYFEKSETPELSISADFSNLNTLNRQVILEQLRSNQQNITMGLKSQSSSESEFEERVVTSEEVEAKKQNPLKNYRSKKEFYTKSKTEKVIKSKPRADISPSSNTKQLKSIERKNRGTLQVKIEFREDDLIHSISQLEIKKRKYLRNLEPFRKKQMKLAKCESPPNPVLNYHHHEGQTQPIIKSHKYYKKRDKNILSIIEIGKEENLNESKDIKEVHPSSSAKSYAKIDYGIHNRLNTLDYLGKQKKLSQFLQGTNSVKKQLQSYVPQSIKQYYYPRQQVLRAKKGTSRVACTKVEELLIKINGLKPNVSLQAKEK